MLEADENLIGNKCKFVCFNVFILGNTNMVYMLVLLFAFAFKLYLIVKYNCYQINSINQSSTCPSKKHFYIFMLKYVSE